MKQDVAAGVQTTCKTYAVEKKRPRPDVSGNCRRGGAGRAGPGDSFPANRHEAERELEWERPTRRSEAPPVVVRGPDPPRSPACGD